MGIIQCRTGGRSVIAAVTSSPHTGDGGNNSRGDCHLADTLIISIRDVDITYKNEREKLKEEFISKLILSTAAPDESSATPYGPFNSADVAGPLSPLYPKLVLLPAIVLMTPVDTVTLRMRPLSAMYTLPGIQLYNNE